MDDGRAAAAGVARLPEETPEVVRKHLAAAEAALMLVESLMLALVDSRVLTSQQLIEAVETVIDTKRQFVAEGSHPGISAIAAGLVTTVANSLAATAEAGAAAVAAATASRDGPSSGDRAQG